MNENQSAFCLTNFLTNLSNEPGVYRMLDAEGTVLYVGKARELKKRVSSYFNKQVQAAKTQSLVKQVASIEVSVTKTETEALLLESNLIKALRPKYNILLRDDKSYPYIHVTKTHSFPRIELYRSKHKPQNGLFFGPYPSVTAARATISTIQKIFKIRTCRDSYFAMRSRPCLQYQIKRCTAPCVAYITEDEYAKAVKQAIYFLQGKSQEVLEQLAGWMDEAVHRFAFEEAAIFRDQIKQLRLIQEQQHVTQREGNADVVVMHAQPGFACIQCVIVRDGQVLMNQAFFPSVPPSDFIDDEAGESLLLDHVFEAFLRFYYLDTPERIPPLILTDKPLKETVLLETMLTALRQKPCKIKVAKRGVEVGWLDFARNNLRISMAEHNVSSSLLQKRYMALQQLLKREEAITRMECFDISHTQGEETVASCVVFDEQGPSKRAYRRFNIQGITPGDDYAAMEQALTRRLKRLVTEGHLPDLLIVDGGKGQMRVAERVLKSLDVYDRVTLIGIAKGPSRKAGWERLLLRTADNQEQILPADSPALHLLQHIRDEAHRFAITTHRNKRAKASLKSSLESIEGVGAKRRQALLRRFGGLRELSQAPYEEIYKVGGISESLAKRIYTYFHPLKDD